MKKLLSIFLALLMLSFMLFACDKDNDIMNTDATSSSEETSSLEDESSHNDTEPLSRKDKVSFSGFPDNSVIMAQNENGEDYILYGYNNATYVLEVSCGAENIEPLKGVLKEETYFLWELPPFADIPNNVIIDDIDDNLLIYFRSFNEYKKVQEKILNLLSSLEYVKSVKIKSIVFGNREDLTGFEFITIDGEIDKNVVLKAYSDLEKLPESYRNEISDDITEQTFEDNIVLAINRLHGAIYTKLIDRYYNFQYENEKIYLTYEYDDDFGGSDALWPSLSFVIIPKSIIESIDDIGTDCEIVIMWAPIEETDQTDSFYKDKSNSSTGIELR